MPGRESIRPYPARPRVWTPVRSDTRLPANEALVHTYIHDSDSFAGAAADDPVGFVLAQENNTWGFELDNDPVASSADQQIRRAAGGRQRPPWLRPVPEWSESRNQWRGGGDTGCFRCRDN